MEETRESINEAIGHTEHIEFAQIDVKQDGVLQYTSIETKSGEQIDPSNVAIINNSLALIADEDYIIVLEDKKKTGNECEACKGKRYTEIECSTCEGQGVLESCIVNCFRCEGSGDNGLGGVCLSCQGSKTKVQEGSTCNTCQGVGKVPCETCNGTGVKGGSIVVPEDNIRRPTSGVILSVGPLTKRTKVGQRVLYTTFSGHGIDCRGDDGKLFTIRIMQEHERMCRILGLMNLGDVFIAKKT